MGVELDHSSSTRKRRAQQRATELMFVSPSEPVSEECLSSWPSSSEPSSFRNTASPGLSLCSSEADSGRRDAVWVHGSCWFFILWDVCSVAYLLFPLLSLLAPPWPHLKKTKGNWQAAGQGELSYMISPWGTLLCAFIWKLSFSTSLGNSSHRPVTPKCLCWSIVLVSYWRPHWQLKLSTGIKNGTNCNPFRLLERQGRPRTTIDAVNGDGLLSAQGRCIC